MAKLKPRPGGPLPNTLNREPRNQDLNMVLTPTGQVMTATIERLRPRRV
jgi:hypothetical protein